MSNRCTCSDIPFSPECSYCYEKLYKYMNERDLEIIKIKKKNISKQRCNCIYFVKICLYTCNSCNNDLHIWNTNWKYLH